MSSLADSLAAKIKADGLSNQTAAESIGVSLPSLRGILAGRSLPNARTIAKFAKFLGTGEDEVKAQVAAAKSSGGAKPARAPRGSGKAAKAARGRPRGRKAGGGDLGAALVAIQSAVSAAQGILGDDLALAVHNLDGAKRKVIATLIKGL